MNSDLLVPCENPACDHLTYVRVYGATREEPSFESTDCCEECGDPLEFEEADYADDYYDPAL